MLGLSLFACAQKERPVPPSDGSEPIYISNPQMAIDEVQASTNHAPAYTVLGQSAPDSYKGVVIQNGKKYIK